MGAPIVMKIDDKPISSESDNGRSLDHQPTMDWPGWFEQQRRDIIRREGMLVGSPFPHPWWYPHCGMGPSARCLDEWLIMEISSSIRSKKDWKRKYRDEEIIKKWKSEITDQCKGRTKFIEEVIEYVFKELEWYEELETRWMGSSGFEIGFNDYIVTSDKSVSSEIKEKLQSETLQHVESFGENLDYYPGADEKVIDLVHPYLYPLQYDITPILNDNTIEIVKFKEEIKYAKDRVGNYGISEKFQWLPSLLKLEEGRFTFNSYINNLHPVKYKHLYKFIEHVFNAVIPGLSYTLTRYASKEFLRIEIPDREEVYSEEYQAKTKELYDKLRDENEDDEIVDRELQELNQRKSDYVVDIKPRWQEPPEFDHIIDVKSFKNLKVVVKLSNIELTPGKPIYSGGSWHVQGTINEDIIATVLYYYDMDNISESRLSFRAGFEDPNYEQGDTFYSEYFYGIKYGDIMVKNIGSVEAKEDRIVIFPNMYQHHVDPFELKDKTKPGYRKILCFFICDPYNTNVVATDKVPPQQEDWWNDPELNYLYPGNIKEQILQLKEGCEWPMSLKEAGLVRRELVEERNLIPDEEHENAFKRRFSMCED